MNKASLWAVVAGVLVVLIVTTLFDLLLHQLGVFPPQGQPIDDRQALIASSYRIPITIGAAWLTARLAPRRPLKHALILGVVGVVLGLAGVFATWNLGLGPRWYPISLPALSLPESWLGGWLFERSGTARG